MMPMAAPRPPIASGRRQYYGQRRKFEAEQANYTVGSNVMTGYEVMPWQGYLTFTRRSSPGTAYTAAENNSGTFSRRRGPIRMPVRN